MKKNFTFLFLISMLFFISMESIAQQDTCPCGNYLVKFEYDKDTRTFLPEGGDAKGIAITNITFNDDNPPEPMSVAWTSSEWYICAVGIKHGPIYTTQSFDPPVTSGTSATPNNNAVSHLVFCADGLIPVELTSFAAQTDGKIVTLKWMTATETENLGFHVFRNTAENGDYVQITTEMILGAGSSDEAHAYSYADRDVHAGNSYYYKLADVDFNGTIKFHGPISVTVAGVPGNYSLAQCYPNPFNPETAINFSLKEAGKVSLRIYNLNGQVIRTLVDSEKTAGSYSVMWNGTTDQGARVSSGTYLYTLKVNGFEETKKMSFMK